MPTVAAVRLRHNPKSYWFDLAGITPKRGSHVLVETERGREIGLVVNPATEVTDEQVAELKTPLKPLIRVLDKNDYDRVDELAARGREAMQVYRELIEKNELDMRPVEVEFLFSGDKAVFYYTSENRVDFRDLVRDLAAYFHMRIDMRQIGARDEARMVGGLAHCGEVLCCARIGGEFDSVSIRMAKEQDLSLNPVKISGACGRLMCCLRYEYEAYKEFRQRAPKKGTLIETPLGSAKVTDLDTPREVIHMQFEDGKALSVPLVDLECEKDATGCICQCRASREVIDRCASSSIMLALSALDRELDQLTDTLETEVESLQVRPQTRRRRRGSNGEVLEQDEDTRTKTRFDEGDWEDSNDLSLDVRVPHQQGRKLRRSSRGKQSLGAELSQQRQPQQTPVRKTSTGQPVPRQATPKKPPVNQRSRSAQAHTPTQAQTPVQTRTTVKTQVQAQAQLKPHQQTQEQSQQAAQQTPQLGGRQQPQLKTPQQGGRQQPKPKTQQQGGRQQTQQVSQQGQRQGQQQGQQQRQQQGQQAQQQPKKQNRPRPGQHSSGLRNPQAPTPSTSQDRDKTPGRRRRRRSEGGNTM